ncbi:hypothetical protein [Virgisporangium aliadipatigenens]|nr:hypothetical protein [Virgisporangium aliadipatigenens]
MDHEGQRVSRRSLFAGVTSLGFGGVLAACGDDDGKARPRTDLVGLFSDANVCTLTPTVTQGPYYFDADKVRGDIREDRPGKKLRLVIRLQDSEGCAPIGDAIVELWHCDAAGVYSGAEAQSTGGGGEGMPSGAPGGAPPGSGAPGPPPAPQNSPGDPAAGPPSGLPGPNDVLPPGAGAPSDVPAPPNPAPGVSPPGGVPGGAPGSPPAGRPGVPGASGATRAGDGMGDLTPTDDKRYLRGAQVTDRNGIVEFTTVWPGWYRGRTVHIHAMVHIDSKRVLTTQMMFDETLNAKVFTEAPYASRTGRDTFNENDPIFQEVMLLKLTEDGDGYLGVIAFAADADSDGR